MEIFEITLPGLSALLIAIIGYWIKSTLKEMKDFIQSISDDIQELKPQVDSNTKEIASLQDYITWLKMHVDIKRLNELDLSMRQNRNSIDEILDYVKWLKDELNAIPQTKKSDES